MFSVSRFHTSILTCNSYLAKFFWENEYWENEYWENEYWENEYWDEKNIHDLVKL